MKFLHTGDFHLGKSLYEHSLIEDQRNMLESIVRVLESDSYDALLIAGDIYDRSAPSAEAVDLFSNFLEALHERTPDLYTFIIPGNHDSASRLSYARAIFKGQRIIFAHEPERCGEPFIIDNGKERAAFFLTPFLYPSAVSGAEDGARSQRETTVKAIERIASALPRGTPSVLLAHLFAIGGEQSSSERVFLGGAELIPASVFAPFAYTALGHLHKPQKITERCRYAGSPLVYAFDEADRQKSILSIELECAGDYAINVREIPITPLRSCVRLKGGFEDFLNGDGYDAYKDCYAEITLTNETVVLNPMSILRKKFPYLLSVKQDIKRAEEDSSYAPEIRLPENGESAEKRIVRDFEAFLTDIYGSAEAEETSLFESELRQLKDCQ